MADALRRALDRSQQMEQVVRLGSALAAVARDKLAIRLSQSRRSGGCAKRLLATSRASFCSRKRAAGSRCGRTRSTLPPTRSRSAATRGNACAPRCSLPKRMPRFPTARAMPPVRRATPRRWCRRCPRPSARHSLARIGAVYRAAGDGKAADRLLLHAVVFAGADGAALDRLEQSFDLDARGRRSGVRGRAPGRGRGGREEQGGAPARLDRRARSGRSRAPASGEGGVRTYSRSHPSRARACGLASGSRRHARVLWARTTRQSASYAPSSPSFPRRK